MLQNNNPYRSEPPFQKSEKFVPKVKISPPEENSLPKPKEKPVKIIDKDLIKGAKNLPFFKGMDKSERVEVAEDAIKEMGKKSWKDLKSLERGMKGPLGDLRKEASLGEVYKDRLQAKHDSELLKKIIEKLKK